MAVKSVGYPNTLAVSEVTLAFYVENSLAAVHLGFKIDSLFSA